MAKIVCPKTAEVRITGNDESVTASEACRVVDPRIEAAQTNELNG